MMPLPLLKMRCGSGFDSAEPFGRELRAERLVAGQPRIRAEMQNNNTSADYTDSRRLLINTINIFFLICAICVICG